MSEPGSGPGAKATGVALRMAGPDDLDLLGRMFVAAHAERQGEVDGAALTAGIAPLLDGSPHGAIWLIGPPRSPVGHVAVSFGWSIDRGGIEARVIDLHVRAAVRRRGMAGGALSALAPALLRDGGVTAIAAYTGGDEALRRLFRRAGFRPEDDRWMVRA